MPLQHALHEADAIIIGAGIFGLYAALCLQNQGRRVIVLEKGLQPFARASAINQARVHNGYHYPRSYDTAKKVADYYRQFNEEFSFAINTAYTHIYAISQNNSKTSADQFVQFCTQVGIPLHEVSSDQYFKKGTVQAAFSVEEFSFDFRKMRAYFLDRMTNRTKFIYDAHICGVERHATHYSLHLEHGKQYTAPLVINATYSGINDILQKFGQQPFPLKYELCEVALCTAPVELQHIGVTVMDGDFFSFIPFGENSMHSLTSVGHTPHKVCYDTVPHFESCVTEEPCEMHGRRNCIVCGAKLQSAWKSMYNLSRAYMLPMFTLNYLSSKFEIKPILLSSEDNDSRPTIIQQHTSDPTFISIFSGKISTIYDLKHCL